MIFKTFTRYIVMFLGMFFLVACGNSGMDENIAQDIKFMAEAACELKKIAKKKGISMQEKNKLMLELMPKLKLMKEAKERVEKYRKSLSGDELKEFKAAGLKMMSEMNLECLK